MLLAIIPVAASLMAGQVDPVSSSDLSAPYIVTQASASGTGASKAGGIGQDRVAASAVGVVEAAEAETAPQYFVAPGGTNSPSRGSAEAPWQTLSYALANVPDVGATIIVADGLYVGAVSLNRHFSLPLTVSAEHPYAARFRSADGSARAFYSYNGSNVRFEGLEIFGSGGTGSEYLIHLGSSDVNDITFADCIIHDCYTNDMVKINSGAHHIRFTGCVFYNQAAGANHFDINTTTDIELDGNIFFNDYASSGRPADTSGSAFICAKNSGDSSPNTTKRIGIRGNVFLNYQGMADQAYVLLGEDYKPFYEAQEVVVENNLFLFTSQSPHIGAFQMKGRLRDITFRGNTVSGHPQGGSAYAVRMWQEGGLKEDVRFTGNVWSDPVGMVDFSDGSKENVIGELTLRHNLYWNAGKPIPADSDSVFQLPADDPQGVYADPQLANPAGAVLPRFDESQGTFASGTATIAEEFERLVVTYGRPDAATLVADVASAEEMPAQDILGRPRGSEPDLGALQVNPAETNTAPTLEPIGDRRVRELAPIEFTANATDPDAPPDPLTFSLSGAVPDGAAIDELTGEFHWTPTALQAPGVYTFTVAVSDGLLGDEEEITVTISVAYLAGSDGNDTFELTAGQVGGLWHSVTLGGSPRSYDPALVDTFQLDGLGGFDRIILTGSAGDDVAVLRPGEVELTDGGYRVSGVGFEEIELDGGAGGNDSAALTGSTASNRLHSYADYAVLTDSARAYRYRVSGLESLTVDVPPGGRNQAFFYDTPHKDRLEAAPSEVVFTRDAEGTPVPTTARGFEQIYAYATPGGGDEALLAGADGGANRFYSFADYSMLTESRRSFYFYTRGFDTVTANSPGSGSAYAYLYDSPGTDRLVASPTFATMTRDAPWTTTTASGFSRTYAYSTRGGEDSAELTGNSAGGNTFRAYPAYATLTDAAHSFYHYARGFRSVTATGAEDIASGDRAWLYDSPLRDTFAPAFWDDLAGKYTGGVLTDELAGDPATGSYRNAFRYFDLVYARSNDGQANDTIDVLDWELLAYRLIWAGVW